MEQSFSFNIDVLGSCNLKCPSCPVGNFKEVKNPTGFMSPELLREILSKALNEYKISFIYLYNWTEPLLHPQLPELIEVIHSLGLACGLIASAIK
jgi:MoaA/NifB/PqqE/SkfB family radical SAM enzyme